MVQEKHLKELFKYIEANWDVCVSQVDKTDIKRIFGGVLCEDIMNDTLHEVKAEPEELKGNCSTFDMSRLVDQEYKPTDQVTDQEPEQVAEPTEQPAQPSSQGILDKPFDKDRFERMFCAVVASGRTESFEQDFFATNIRLEKLDAFYASKEKGGNNG